MLAQGIAERSGRERISEIFLSPDAFAHRTAEASIAEQLGDVLTANGLPRRRLAAHVSVAGVRCLADYRELREAHRLFASIGA